MSEPIIVEGKLQKNGSIKPTAFMWKEKRYQIYSIGRTRIKEGVRYFLVSTEKEEVYEIGYDSGGGGWRMYRSMRDFQPPGRKGSAV